jgi:hypothetical protein
MTDAEAVLAEQAPGWLGKIRLQAIDRRNTLSQLGEQRDVGGVAVVEVESDELQVVGGLPPGPGADDPLGQHVLDRHALAASS